MDSEEEKEEEAAGNRKRERFHSVSSAERASEYRRMCSKAAEEGRVSQLEQKHVEEK